MAKKVGINSLTNKLQNLALKFVLTLGLIEILIN